MRPPRRPTSRHRVARLEPLQSLNDRRDTSGRQVHRRRLTTERRVLLRPSLQERLPIDGRDWTAGRAREERFAMQKVDDTRGVVRRLTAHQSIENL